MNRDDRYDHIRAAYRRGATDALFRLRGVTFDGGGRANPHNAADPCEAYIEELKARPLVARFKS